MKDPPKFPSLGDHDESCPNDEEMNAHIEFHDVRDEEDRPDEIEDWAYDVDEKINYVAHVAEILF